MKATVEPEREIRSRTQLYVDVVLTWHRFESQFLVPPSTNWALEGMIMGARMGTRLGACLKGPLVTGGVGRVLFKLRTAAGHWMVTSGDG